MRSSSVHLLGFAILFSLFLIGPALLGSPFEPLPLIKVGDVFDLLTPLVLAPLYWLLYRNGSHSQPGKAQILLFLLLVGVWIEGQGMHLAANSIGHLVNPAEMPEVYAVTFFYDELLSHYLWHGATIALSTVIIWREAITERAWDRTLFALVGPAAVLYGLTYFLIIVEGNTAPIGVPFAALATIVLLVAGRRRLIDHPRGAFFGIAYASSLVLFLGWWAYWGRLVPPCEVIGC